MVYRPPCLARGHVDHGIPAPWVDISAPNKPEERFVGQNLAFERVAKKYNIEIGESHRLGSDEGYDEAMGECSKNGETAEYKGWAKENGKLMQKAQGLLGAFYHSRRVDEHIKLKIDESVGGFRIYNGSRAYEYMTENESEFSEKEKKIRTENLEKCRLEMQEFTGFLKEHYFNA